MAVYSVAAAMEYLINKHFLYRDLGCRNVLVKKENGQLCFKLGDFGTCCYVGDTNGVYREKVIIYLN